MQSQPGEIYYETSVHKKFLADVYAVIPKGRKCVLWFKQNQCWMFQIARRPYTPNTNNSPNSPFIHGKVQYEEARMIHMPFTNAAWYAGQGTMIYGTCVFEKRKDVQKRFSVENVIWLCGEKQPDNGTLGRFSAFFDAYSQERAKHHFQLHMPIMHSAFNDAVRDAIKITSYEVFCIQHRFLNRPCIEFKNLAMSHIDIDATSVVDKPLFFPKQANTSSVAPSVATRATSVAPSVATRATSVAPSVATRAPSVATASVATRAPSVATASLVQYKSQTRTFVIAPDAQNDIYYVLRSSDEPITANTMIAHIPNYKTSVMMNALFRNIKENRNLDALEESDEEDEALIPLVDVNKRVRMSCTFSARFKRWQPVGLQPFQS
jgi:N-acetylmuramoyl-L-alanine amidase CwlA